MKKIFSMLLAVLMIVTVFGACLPVAAADTAPAVSCSLVLDEKISLRLSIAATNFPGKNPVLVAKTGSYEVTVNGTASGNNYDFKVGVAPSLASKTVSLTFKDGDTEVVTKEASVLAYIAAMLPNADDALRTLLVDLLNYCAECETLAGTAGDEGSVNSVLSDFEKYQKYATGNLVFGTTKALTGTENGVTLKNIAVLSAAAPVFRLTFVSAASDCKVTVKYTDLAAGVTTEKTAVFASVPVEGKENTYTADVAIPAACITGDVVFTVNGTSVNSKTLSYNIFDLLSHNPSSKAVNALAKYSSSARTYFNQAACDHKYSTEPVEASAASLTKSQILCKTCDTCGYKSYYAGKAPLAFVDVRVKQGLEDASVIATATGAGGGTNLTDYFDFKGVGAEDVYITAETLQSYIDSNTARNVDFVTGGAKLSIVNNAKYGGYSYLAPKTTADGKLTYMHLSSENAAAVGVTLTGLALAANNELGTDFANTDAGDSQAYKKLITDYGFTLEMTLRLKMTLGKTVGLFCCTAGISDQTTNGVAGKGNWGFAVDKYNVPYAYIYNASGKSGFSPKFMQNTGKWSASVDGNWFYTYTIVVTPTASGNTVQLYVDGKKVSGVNVQNIEKIFLADDAENLHKFYIGADTANDGTQTLISGSAIDFPLYAGKAGSFIDLYGFKFYTAALTADQVAASFKDSASLFTECAHAPVSGEILQKTDGTYTTAAEGYKTIKPATCEPAENGTAGVTCKYCGKVYGETIEILGGHKYAADGVTGLTGTIKETEQTVSDTKASDGWKAVTAASCTEDGEYTRTCVSCGKFTQTLAVKATGHKWGEGTTGLAGTIDGTDEAVTNSKASDGWKVTLEATCTETGKAERKCSECGTVQYLTVSTSGHDFTAATAYGTDADGNRTLHCSKCDKDVSQNLPVPYMDLLVSRTYDGTAALTTDGTFTNLLSGGANVLWNRGLGADKITVRSFSMSNEGIDYKAPTKDSNFASITLKGSENGGSSLAVQMTDVAMKEAFEKGITVEMLYKVKLAQINAKGIGLFSGVRTQTAESELLANPSAVRATTDNWGILLQGTSRVYTDKLSTPVGAPGFVGASDKSKTKFGDKGNVGYLINAVNTNPISTDGTEYVHLLMSYRPLSDAEATTEKLKGKFVYMFCVNGTPVKFSSNSNANFLSDVHATANGKSYGNNALGYECGISGGYNASTLTIRNWHPFLETGVNNLDKNLFYIGANPDAAGEGTQNNLKGSADNSIEVVNVKFYLEGMNATQAHDAYKATTSEFGLNLD